ncbi:MAG: gamma carbonic anhydrase family protein [Candidatus Muiribacteriaceae bacterium]
MLRELKGIFPDIEEDVYIDKQSTLIGNVKIKSGSSVWPGASLRGDMNSIEVGKGSNIQDNASLHTRLDNTVVIGDYVTVGHNAVIHGAHVSDNCLIGMGAVILDGAVVGRNSIVGAGALVPPGRDIPEDSLVVGMPAKVVRTLSEDEIIAVRQNAEDYIALKKEYD